MLASCLILGCAISSFAYRRQEQDRYQNPIFILAITAASIFGLGMGVNTNLIMLGLIPWALCFSMVFSCTVHWLVRRCSPRPRYIFYEINEKEALLHHWSSMIGATACRSGRSFRYLPLCLLWYFTSIYHYDENLALKPMIGHNW